MDASDPRLLDELDRLFGSDGIEDCANDARWNCYAKAFVGKWLLRLWGESGDLYEGQLCIVNADRNEIFRISPHAWAGISEKKILDLSIRNIGDLRYMSVLGKQVMEDSKWRVYIEKDEAKFTKLGTSFSPKAPERFLTYFPQQVHQFAFEEIHDRHASMSPSVARQLGRFSQNLLPKAVLHIYRFAEEERAAISAKDCSSSWDCLAEWDVDALGHLKNLLS